MTKAEKENGVEIPEPTAPDVSVREPSIPDEKAPISTEGSEPCALDPRVVRIWRLENLASSGLLFAGTAGGSFALGVFTAFPLLVIPPRSARHRIALRRSLAKIGHDSPLPGSACRPVERPAGTALWIGVAGNSHGRNPARFLQARRIKRRNRRDPAGKTDQ